MIEKEVLCQDRVRRIGGSFAFIEHRFLRDGFFASLTHDELLLYVFLVMAADRAGLSYYSYDKICALLAMDVDQYIVARNALRVEALKICGRDTVMAEVWDCGEDQALLRLLCAQRRWDAVEEAAIIRELVSAHGFSQAQVARMLCKDPSWVDRRLSLLDCLPDEVLDSVRSGRVSSWAASRVLAPLARANADHASAINGWLVREHVSTRDLTAFFDHYKKSGQRVRERMVGDPSLFIKTLGAQRWTREAGEIREGPEGKWLSDLGSAARIVKRLAQAWETVLHCDRWSAILATLGERGSLIGDLNHKLRSRADDHAGDGRGCPDSGEKGNGNPPDWCNPEDIEKHGETGAAGDRAG